MRCSSSESARSTTSKLLHQTMQIDCGTLGTSNTHSPGRLVRSRDLAIYLFTPGFSFAYHAHVLGVSGTTLRKHLAWSRDLASHDPTIAGCVIANVASITADDGLKMAQRRGATQLPWWSRLAIADFAFRMEGTREVADLFACSRRTVQLALRRLPISFDPLTGERRLSRSQSSPPGKWSKREER